MFLATLTGVLLLGCGGNDEVIPFTVHTPEGQDTFAGVSEVRLTFGDHETTTSLASSGSAFELEIKLPVGETGEVVLEGLNASGDVVCRGRSPQVLSYPSSDPLVLFVSRVGTFGRAPVDAPLGATAMAMAHYEVEDWDDLDSDDITTTLWFGGYTPDASIVQTPIFYDSYFHDVYDLTALPDPRYGMSAMNIDGGYFLLFGGRGLDGTYSERLDMMMPGSYVFEYSADIDYGLTGAARANAPVITLGPYPSLLLGYDVRVMNSFLIVGGDGPTGPVCDALHLMSTYDTGTYVWSVAAERRLLAACRSGHTATLTKTLAGADTVMVVLIYGGAAAGEPVAELLQVNPQQPDVETVNWGWVETTVDPDPSAMIRDHAALTLPDGRVLVVGGRTLDGTVLADGVLFDPGDGSFTRVESMLTTARYGHTAERVGNELVVAGGTDASGIPVGDAEIFDVSDDVPSFEAAVDLVVPRTGHHVFLMPTGTMGLLGGVDSSGAPTTVIELYTPGLVL
ncbi:MAG: kelch repeat-containing protein [bacterium]